MIQDLAARVKPGQREIPVSADDLESVLEKVNGPRLKFKDGHPISFLFDGELGLFACEDCARYARVLFLNPGVTMSLRAAKEIDPLLPDKIKGGFVVEKLPAPFRDCIAKEPGHRGFRFDLKRFNDLPKSGVT